MKNFIFHNPTKILFGQGMLDKLPQELAPYGDKILLV
ncbi:MAG: iron-containing alcohol dehydrogenase, partial [Clostridiaceae bacterium]|nr:iron-containing alcohol dehydrogenase [Clostridiaceae bacterium]